MTLPIFTSCRTSSLLRPTRIGFGSPPAPSPLWPRGPGAASRRSSRGRSARRYAQRRRFRALAHEHRRLEPVWKEVGEDVAIHAVERIHVRQVEHLRRNPTAAAPGGPPSPPPPPPPPSPAARTPWPPVASAAAPPPRPADSAPAAPAGAAGGSAPAAADGESAPPTPRPAPAMVAPPTPGSPDIRRRRQRARIESRPAHAFFLGLASAAPQLDNRARGIAVAERLRISPRRCAASRRRCSRQHDDVGGRHFHAHRHRRESPAVAVNQHRRHAASAGGHTLRRQMAHRLRLDLCRAAPAAPHRRGMFAARWCAAASVPSSSPPMTPDTVRSAERRRHDRNQALPRLEVLDVERARALERFQKLVRCGR